MDMIDTKREIWKASNCSFAKTLGPVELASNAQLQSGTLLEE